MVGRGPYICRECQGIVVHKPWPNPWKELQHLGEAAEVKCKKQQA
jgi:hypothetical protein